jgi:hypothetical protein
LLETLNTEDGLFDTFELAARAFDVQPDNAGQLLVTEAQLVSVRRALRKLAKTTAIYDLSRHWPDGRQRWAGERLGLRYTIRRMQQENLSLPSTDTAAFRKRLAEMEPLLNRARELGVDYR